MLRSRDAEIAAINQLLDSARAGRGGGLVLRGEPGIGKSALLREAVGMASGMCVLRATGVEAESALAHAVLHQLLHPIQQYAADLPAPQRDALQVALGLAAGAATDRFLLLLAALTLLSDTANKQPILCVLDDANWADEPSLEVVEFVARRVETEPIAFVASVHGGTGRDLQAAGMHLLDVPGLKPEDAATLLDEAMLQRSGYAAATGALERAAELSPTESARVRRVVAAAEAAWLAGDPTRASGLLNRAEQLGLREASVRLRARYVRGSIELRSGVPADGLSTLLDAVEESGAADPRLATRALAVAGEASFQAGQAASRISPLLTTLPMTNDPGQMALVSGYRAIEPAASPNDLAVFRQELAAGEQLEGLDVLIRVAGLAFGVGEYAVARRLWARTASVARLRGAAGSLAAALRPIALDEMYRCRYVWAEASAAEGQALASETGQPNLAWQYAALLAELAGIRGREVEARALAEEVLREASNRGLQGTAALMRRALGQLCLAVGRPEEAIGHLKALWSLNDSSHRAIALGVIPDLVEASVRSGRPELAERWLGRLLSIDEGTFPEAMALVMRSRALVASGDQADDEFQQALRVHSGTDRPVDQTRTELLYGEYLRRERRRVEAREPLRSAVEAFDRLGAVLWAERARSELRATGETARKREPNSLDQLTRQELQVMRAVAQGITNREVAAQLFISPRTVDHHLRSIFLKLGISSRSELIRLALAGAPDS